MLAHQPETQTDRVAQNTGFTDPVAVPQKTIGVPQLSSTYLPGQKFVISLQLAAYYAKRPKSSFRQVLAYLIKDRPDFIPAAMWVEMVAFAAMEWERLSKGEGQ